MWHATCNGLCKDLWTTLWAAAFHPVITDAGAGRGFRRAQGWPWKFLYHSMCWRWGRGAVPVPLRPLPSTESVGFCVDKSTDETTGKRFYSLFAAFYGRAGTDSRPAQPDGWSSAAGHVRHRAGGGRAGRTHSAAAAAVPRLSGSRPPKRVSWSSPSQRPAITPSSITQ